MRRATAPPTGLSADLRPLVDFLHHEAPRWRSERYQILIDPWWVETPERRSQLWLMVARLEEVDMEARCRAPRSAPPT